MAQRDLGTAGQKVPSSSPGKVTFFGEKQNFRLVNGSQKRPLACDVSIMKTPYKLTCLIKR